VGSNATMLAVGVGGDVTVINRSPAPLQRLTAKFGLRVKTMVSTTGVMEKVLPEADAVIGAALVPGALAPKLLTRVMLSAMKPGAVLVDVAIDQGGCFETSRPTTHAEPVYVVDGILHYCVANMPGAVPRTSTYALNHATLSFVKELADHGAKQAAETNEHLRNGVSVCCGAVTRRELAESQGLPYVDVMTALYGH
jgi:alanine dehydrogenase